jgi:tryptophanyl-tRNA synthetase
MRHPHLPAVAILEDDPERVEHMRRVLKATLPTCEQRFFAAAPDMIAWLAEHLVRVVLISLDHDLDSIVPIAQQATDPGCGRDVADWIAAGIDPEKSTIFAQSLVPEHAELYLLLQMVTPIPWLERVPTYKEQIEQMTDRDLSSIGFLGYPLLQTADVAMYDGAFVPVGDDQVPHLEMGREVVRRFNNLYGQTLVEAQPLLTATPRLPGLDNRKMSKSYGNTIDLSDTPDDVVKKVKQMYTDPKRVRADIPGTVEGNPVFIYHDAFNPNRAEVEDLKARYGSGKVGDVEVKMKLAAAINTMLEPLRQRRREVVAKPGRVREILMAGSERAGRQAHETMARVREAMKLRY